MLSKSKNFKDLIVWQKAHQLVLEIYRFTSGFPEHEKYCLVNQFRRAAVSIPANIVEGYRKESTREKLHYFNISQASLEECGYYLILSEDLGYGENENIQRLYRETGKLLISYRRGIRQKQ